MQIRSLSVPLVAGLLGVALSAPLAAQDFTYERQGDTLVRLEGGTRFVVDPTVVSARFAPGVNDYSDLLEQLGGDPGVLAGGISEALVATAVGLLVAIPAVMAFNYFNSRVEGFLIDMNDVASEVINFVLKEGRY